MRTAIILLVILLLASTVSSYPYNDAKMYYVGSSDQGRKYSVFFGRYDSDNYDDIFLVTSENDTVRVDVLRGKGNGEFDPIRGLPIDCAEFEWYPSYWLVFDYPPIDGLDDIVTRNGSNIIVFKNNGNGSWERIDYPKGVGDIQHLLGFYDCNGDNNPDIYALSVISTQGYVAILPTGGVGGISVALEDWSAPYPFGDFNNDGSPDVLTSVYMSCSTINVFYGWGPCMLWDVCYPWVLHQTFGSPASIRSVNVADFNADGFDDIVYETGGNFMPDGSYFTIRLGSEDGLVYYSTNYWIKNHFNSDAVLFSLDADSDGYDDIGIVSTREQPIDGEIPVYFHFGSSNSIGSRCDTVIVDGEQHSYFSVHDLNSDGYDDIVYRPYSDSLGVLINSGPVATLLYSSSITKINTNHVKIEWALSSIDDISKFIIYRSAPEGEDIVGVVECIQDQYAYDILDDISALHGTTLKYMIYACTYADAKILLASEEIEIPSIGTELYPNYPNPFNPNTNISFKLANSASVSIQIYDASGRLIADILKDQYYPGGRHTVSWDGTDNSKQIIGSGLYFCRMIAGKEILSRKVILLR